MSGIFGTVEYKPVKTEDLLDAESGVTDKKTDEPTTRRCPTLAQCATKACNVGGKALSCGTAAGDKFLTYSGLKYLYNSRPVQFGFEYAVNKPAAFCASVTGRVLDSEVTPQVAYGAVIGLGALQNAWKGDCNYTVKSSTHNRDLAIAGSLAATGLFSAGQKIVHQKRAEPEDTLIKSIWNAKSKLVGDAVAICTGITAFVLTLNK